MKKRKVLIILAINLATILLFTYFYTLQATADTVINDMTIGPGYGLPKTGQTTVYQTGDDGTYQKGYSGTRFTNNADGTITDNATGLMWVASPTAAGVGGTYKWYDSILLTYPAIAACENLSYAGYTDWRLPNAKELQSIVDYGRYSPSIDTTYFTSQSSNYYSSTTDALNTGSAWVVYFGYGNVYGSVKTNPGFVRPVRGGQ